MTKKKIAVIGSGYWGKNLVRNFHALSTLHTICDTNQHTLDTFKQQYPAIQTDHSYANILENDAIKGIAIATPAETHYSLVHDAILAGKDVYVEKPICLSEKKGHALNKLAQGHQRILMVGHLLWYHPLVLKLKEIVDHGKLGRIQYIYSNRLNLGKLRREENVLWSFAPHDISIILGLINEIPETIQAQGGNYLHPKIADTTVTLLNFPSGVKAHIFVSWLHPFKEQKLVVVGDKQMAVFDDTASWSKKLTLYPHTVDWNENIPVANKAEAIHITVDEAEPLKEECQHFLNCIKTREKPRTDGEEGLRVLHILNCCQEALKSEQKIKVSPTPRHPATSNYFIHSTAKIDANVFIGKNSKIWHFSHILANASIGDNCNLGQNVVISNRVKIGDNCKIQNNVSIYEGVELEDHVFCGPSMVFTNVNNPRCEFPQKNKYLTTLVRKGVTIGANATIVCGVTLGEYAFIGAGSVIINDVPAFALMVGNPARQIGWMSRFGKKLDLPLTGTGTTTCEETGDTYILSKDNGVFLQ